MRAPTASDCERKGGNGRDEMGWAAAQERRRGREGDGPAGETGQQAENGEVRGERFISFFFFKFDFQITFSIDFQILSKILSKPLITKYLCNSMHA
jgi:hypothetical protein